jgi:hydroxyacylglutathione hydrolase
VALEIFLHRVVGPLQCNCYVVGDPATRQAILIDPGGDADALIEDLAEARVEVTAIVATHAHFDHIVAAERVRAATGAPFHLHKGDLQLLDWFQESGRLLLGIDLGSPPDVDTSPSEGDLLRAGEVELQVLHTPGHSPGSISLVADGALFSGDTLFAGSIGRSDLPGGDGRALLNAIQEKLLGLGDDVKVYPGHGPPTTIEREKAYNPFL